MQKDIESRLVKSAPFYLLGMALAFLFAPGSISTILVAACGVLWMVYIFRIGMKKDEK